MEIRKINETMTSRERVRRTFEFEKTDRPPIGYDSNAAIDRKFREYLGVEKESRETFYEAIGMDYRPIGAPYIGPALFPPAPEGKHRDPLEGFITRWVEHETGGYWDFCDFPLKDADDEAFDNYPVPDPDHFDYEEAARRARSYGGKYSLYLGSPGVPDIINSNGRIMGMEDTLVHLICEDKAALNLMKRRAKSSLKIMERTLAACKGEIDFIWLGEDLGTQIAPMISLELYRKTIKPIQKEYTDLAKEYGLPVMIHTCGSSSWAYEDFIEIGVKCVDTLQPEAANMSPAYLLEHFGGRLNLRGCISTAGPLAYGTAEDVRKNCFDVLTLMKPYGGYHFAPTHAIQDNSPVENVFAMYQSVYDFCR